MAYEKGKNKLSVKFINSSKLIECDLMPSPNTYYARRLPILWLPGPANSSQYLQKKSFIENTGRFIGCFNH